MQPKKVTLLKNMEKMVVRSLTVTFPQRDTIIIDEDVQSYHFSPPVRLSTAAAPLPSAAFAPGLFRGRFKTLSQVEGADSYRLDPRTLRILMRHTEAYPVFRSATVEQIFSMEEIAPGQLRWELLDADIEIEALAHPAKFPLKYVD